jgi:thiol:disulfide interchange protein DsbD
LQKILPKPGAWMAKLKIVLSLPILLTCIWLASVLVAQIYSPVGINKNNLDWQEYDASRVQEEVSSGRKVFIDFTAEWCLTCMFNEKTRLNGKKFAEFIEKNDVALFKADLTESNDEYNEALSAYGRDGIPVYIFYENGTYRILPIFFDISDLSEEK